MGKYVLGESAARRLREIFASSDGLSRRAACAGGALHVETFANPFEVQWAASADSGSGSFIIWLPSSAVLVVDGQPIDLTSDLTDAGAPYPTGWYLLEDMPSSGGSLYLNVTPGNPDASPAEDPEAEFSTTASQTEGDIPILIATVSKDSTTGAVTVKQTVTSALVFGTGKGAAAETTPAPFDYVETESQQNGQTVVSKSITRCSFYFDGVLRTLADYATLPNPAGSVYLVCTGTLDSETGEYSWTFALQNQAGGESSTGMKIVSIKLYDFADGKPSVDYRTTFLSLNQTSGLGEKKFTFDETDIATIMADDDIDIGQKTLEAGSGISLSVSADGNTITISATGGSASTSGYTGTRTILADTDYDSNYRALRRRYITETWVNGVMTNQVLGSWESYHQAVQETV